MLIANVKAAGIGNVCVEVSIQLCCHAPIRNALDSPCGKQNLQNGGHLSA